MQRVSCGNIRRPVSSMHLLNAMALLLSAAHSSFAMHTPTPSFSVAFPIQALNLHNLPRESPLAMSMHCSECGCTCLESSDPATADVIVHTDLMLWYEPRYSEEEMAKISRYNPTGLRVLLSMESTFWHPNMRNASILEHFDAVASYERGAQLPLFYGPVPTEVPAFPFNAPYLPPHTWSSVDTFSEESVTKRQKAIAVFMTHCVPWRMRLIDDLQQHVEIDTFGRCFPGRPQTDPLKQGENMKLRSMLEYKMVLALENSICDDYATEKLYGPLLHGAIPVYLGAPNVEDLVPDKAAIINLLDFADARAAAAYLRAMLDDPTAMYQKHHAWRHRPYTGAFADRLTHSYKHKNFYCNLCSFYREKTMGRRTVLRGIGVKHGRGAAPMLPCADVGSNMTWPFRV